MAHNQDTMKNRVSIPLIGLIAYTLAIIVATSGMAFLIVEWRGGDGGSGAAGSPGAEAPAPILPTQAEEFAVGYLHNYTDQFPASDERAALDEGFEPACDAVFRTEADNGWLVHCRFAHDDGRELPRFFDLVVADDGTVSADESAGS